LRAHLQWEIVRQNDNALQIGGKLDALEDIIEAANGRPVLVAYWFKHDLRRICKRFDVREIKSSRDIADWNEGKIPVAVIHPASAGHGLNLQAGGSHLVWFGLTWSLELYQQTNARLWRQGQTSETVVIQHIITKGTIDERLRERYRQAVEYMDWFKPAWDELSEDEQYVLETFYQNDGSQTGAVYDICDYFHVERSSAYNRKNRALDHLTTLLYGKA